MISPPSWSPFRHDARYDQELVDPRFARASAALRTTAATLVLDDVAAGSGFAGSGGTRSG